MLRAAAVPGAIAVLISIASPVQAQTCGRAPFSVARTGPGTSTVRPAVGSPISRLAALCRTPSPPNFVAEDSKALLAKIKLTREQKDSATAIQHVYVALQKTLTDSTAAAHEVAMAEELEKGAKVERPDARALYLTPSMQKLRDLHGNALRSLLAPEQVVAFDANLAALRKKEADTKGA